MWIRTDKSGVVSTRKGDQVVPAAWQGLDEVEVRLLRGKRGAWCLHGPCSITEAAEWINGFCRALDNGMAYFDGRTK